MNKMETPAFERHGFLPRLIASAVLAWLGIVASPPAWSQNLLHRYSFDADTSDLVADADGWLGGNAQIANGAASLDGSDAFVDLPNDLVSSLTNVTFEIWATWNGGTPYQSLISFGSNSNGEDLQGQATKVLSLTPHNGSGLALTIFTNTSAQRSLLAPALSPGVVHQIVWTHDAASSVSKLYVDGHVAASSSNLLLTLKDLGDNDNNWLGRSQYPQDQDFDGSIAEFRIYDGVLSEETIAANYRLGPDPGGKGAVISLEIRGPSALRPGGSKPLLVLGNFENLFGWDVTDDEEISYEVDPPSVLSVSSNGIVTAVGNGGSAQVTARLGGQSVSHTIRIVPLDPPRLEHRYSFDADAADLVGSAHGELMGNAVIQNGAVLLDGTDAYVNLPNDLVRNLTNATLEVWTTWNGGPIWQRIWDFGNSSAGEDERGSATQSIFLTPDNGAGLRVSIFPNGIENEQVVTSGALAKGSLHHIVWAYDSVAETANLYLDGNRMGTNASMTHTLAGLGSTLNNWLGRSQYSWDSDYSGSIAEFRIYDGVLSGEDVARNHALGPDPAGRGALKSLAVEFRESMRLQDSQQLRVLATFERAERIDITRDPALEASVSDPGLLSVGIQGELASIGTVSGSAVVTLGYLGLSANLTVYVLPHPESKLVHRYSFDENANDLIGEAHGVLKGNARIEGGELLLDGIDAYVDLPNGLVKSLTNATFEVWTRWEGGGLWQRIIDFGNSTAGEDSRGSATQSVFLTPNNGASLEVSIFPDGIGGEQTVNAAILSAGEMHHIVWTYDAVSLKGRLFLNGLLVGETRNMTHTLASLGETSNNWLGRSQYSWDADFNGAIREFRIYEGPLSLERVAENYRLGADQISASALRILLSLTEGGVELTWEAPEGGVTLETTEQLDLIGWHAEPSPVEVIEGRSHVRIQPDGRHRFYRLAGRSGQ